MTSKHVYFNRELSWLEFNARVLSEALEPSVPLLERLKFLSIVSSNFDEFFMVRVASLKRQVREGNWSDDPSGLNPAEQLAAIHKRAGQIYREQYRALNGSVLPGLAKAGLTLRGAEDYSPEHREFLADYYRRNIKDILIPLAISEDGRMPSVGNLRITVAFLLSGPEGERLLFVQIPFNLSRFIQLPSAEGQTELALVEDVVASFGNDLFPGCRILERAVFKLARDADFAVDEERDEDFLEAMEEVLVDRQNSTPVRLTITASSGAKLKKSITELFGLMADDVYELNGPIDLRSFMDLIGLNGFDGIRNPNWKPMPAVDFPEEADFWEDIKRRDIMVFTPYESFDPIVRFLDVASADPDVLAIKMTLYRTSGNSPIIKALERAAHSGKQVLALVELKARFDEGRNISWAHRLEKAGAIVVYGIARLKVHAKAIMVIRRERDGIRRYLHLGTGNYNDRTAKLYVDLSLFTANEELCYDASSFFNAITGYSEVQAGRKLVMAPFHLKNRVISMIDREAKRSSQAYPGLIMAKMNALTDVDVIQALYRASASGVRVLLNVRGICALKPGQPGISENIEVLSVVDYYLEHARVFYFSNGGNEELYLSSADWMERNLLKRVELLFPIESDECKRRVLDILKAYFRDNCKAHKLKPDGRWERIEPAAGQDAFRVQEYFYRAALSRANEIEAPKPLLSVRRLSGGEA